MIARNDHHGAVFGELGECFGKEFDGLNGRYRAVEDITCQQQAVNVFSYHQIADRSDEFLLCSAEIELMQRPTQVPVTGVEEAHMEKVGAWSDILTVPRRSVGGMKHPIADAVDVRLAESLHRIESQIDYRPVKVASWGVAAASVLGAVAAGFGAVAAIAGAYAAVKTAIRVSHEGREPRPEISSALSQTEDDSSVPSVHE